MKISVLFFARSRDLAGVNESTVDIREGGTTLDLVDTLLQQYPNLTQLRNAFVLCKNQEYVEHNSAEELSDGDEVAIIPPISGG